MDPQPNSDPNTQSSPNSSSPTVQPQTVVPTTMPADVTAPSASVSTLPAAPINTETPSISGSVINPTPMIGGMSSGGPVSGNPMPGGSVSGNNKKGWLVPVIIAAVLLLLIGGGYVFGIYLPNRPSAIFSTSLKNSGKAVDALVDYSSTAVKKDYKSYALDGSLHVKAAGASYEATVAGSFDQKGNATGTLSADLLGEKVSADLRSVTTTSSSTPDIYLRLSGIKAPLDSFGLSSLDSLDSKWVSIDHTILESATASLDQSAAGLTSATSLPTTAQIQDAVTKVQVVNKNYLFTTDSSTAVLKESSYVGKETKDSRSMYHYKVGYNKDHLQAYVKAVGAALDASSLNTWSKSANDGKSLSKLLDIDGAAKDLSTRNTTKTFDMWVDAKTKVVHTLQFTDASEPNAVFAISQNYTGGDSYPFTLTFTDKADDGSAENINIKLNLNTKTNKSTADMAFTSKTANFTSNFTVTPSNDALQVTAPTGAESIVNVLGALGLSDAL